MDQYEIGMVGLGVMGRNMLLNIADHGYSGAGLDKNAAQIQALHTEGAGKKVAGTDKLDEFLAMLRKPRAIMMLVPAGPPVDSVIREFLPKLDKGDLLTDAGNSHFKDTDLRSKALADKGIHFFGMGVSGGESGARHGPSMMPGGPKDGYARLQPVLEAIAAKVNGEPCVTWLGPGSAGHFVKMVHNGIEYAIMQLLAEVYDLMKRSLGLNNDELHAVFDQWNKAELSSFLVEITAEILKKDDPKTGKRLVDVILDVARQKGTGMWTSQDAMDLHTPIPTIDMAVVMRDLSGFETERAALHKAFGGPTGSYTGDKKAVIGQLRNSTYLGMILAYAQGMDVLRRASKAYGYNLNLGDVAKIWRGGCIIRSAQLEPIRAAFAAQPDFANLMLDPALGKEIKSRVADLRAVVKVGVDLGVPVSALMATLAYFDAFRSGWLPANLIQAQRDFFGAHTYERIDEKGVFHTKWGQVEKS